MQLATISHVAFANCLNMDVSNLANKQTNKNDEGKRVAYPSSSRTSYR